MGFVTSRDADIYYETRGTGPAIVFLHGAGSNAATWWQQVPFFSQAHTCVTIDNRGFGRSGVAAHAYRPSRFADDVLAVLDALDILSAAIVGQSLGGMTALRLALDHPERVSAMIASDSPLGVNHAPLLADFRSYLATAAATQVENRALSKRFVAANPELTYLYTRINAFNPMVYAPERSAGLTPHHGLLAPEYLIDPSRFASLKPPSLFLIGEEDPVVRPAVMREVAALVPKSRFRIIAGAGHSPYFEQPEEFNRTVHEFLELQRR